MSNFWLLKAEPDSRIVKGKDVKFSVDDFESVKTSPWEGVRNYEARNLMKEMKIGEKALFYHSNCKNPGIAAFAEVSKEAYPDYTAWDESHPYYDAKSNKDSPKWFMVDLTFSSRANHFVPLSLLRFIANYGSGSSLPEQIAYIGDDGVTAIKTMDLVTRGRLSVQRVDGNAWTTITLMAGKGGWDGLNFDKKPGTSTPKAKASKEGPSKPTTTPRAKRVAAPAPNKAVKKKKPQDDDDDDDNGDAYEESEPSSEDNYESDDGSDYGKSKSKRGAASRGTKRKIRGKGDDDDDDYTGKTSRRKSQKKN
ncbi:hypothetical protein V5O48_005025 [Marasmius crinis-equi]|uniref:EVE domain-containing protein n=1 Tax=Marasmius crinis-equi TaxID=585013 RepID=A0ABR3FNF0_9AGAR